MSYSSYFKNALRILKINFLDLRSSPHQDLLLFGLSIITIVSIKLIQFPSLTINAEMFAENGTNFFIHALNDNLITNLKTLDAGYLPLTQRLIALFIVKFLKALSMYPFFSQMISIFIIATISSLINLNIFRKIIRQPAIIAFILGISIALISDYELNAFINFIYYGSFFLFLIIFINKEKLRNITLLIYTFLTMLIILSKGQFIVFVPIYMIMLTFHFWHKQYKSFIYYFCALIAGLIQFLIMFFNFSSASPHQTLSSMPYFILKTSYYYVLTYRHVFFGFVTKEKASFFAILILLILMIMGIKRCINLKDKKTLQLFIVANFIAVCSLFLTVIVLNNNINPKVKNVTNTITTTKSVSAMPQKIASDVYNTGRDEKNIFDIKHFANLRSLFFSNLLIFFAGTLIIINIFPKKSHKVIILLILCFTSGAFGQLKTEEVYAKKYQSYSQWNIYNRLLENDQYCIPINHYPFLLHKNCNYLSYEKNGILTTNEKLVLSISLSKINPLSKNWKIQSVILINNPNMFSSNSMFTLFAYDKNNKLIGTAKQLTPSNYNYLYYLFDNQISNAEKFKLIDSNGKEIWINPNVIILGK